MQMFNFWGLYRTPSITDAGDLQLVNFVIVFQDLNFYYNVNEKKKAFVAR